MGRKSHAGDGSSSGGEDGGSLAEGDKAALRRLKNREAAKRVRERRVNAIKTLSDQVDILMTDNLRLREALTSIAQGQAPPSPLEDLLQPPPDLPTEATDVINKIRLTDDKDGLRPATAGAGGHAGGGPSTSSGHSAPLARPMRGASTQTDLSELPPARPTELIHGLMTALQQQHRDMVSKPGVVPASTMEQLQAMMELQLCVQQSMAALMAQQQAAMQHQALMAAAGGGRASAATAGPGAQHPASAAQQQVAQQQQMQQQQALQQQALQQQAQQAQQAMAMMQLASMGQAGVQQAAAGPAAWQAQAQQQMLNMQQQAQQQQQQQQWQQQQQQPGRPVTPVMQHQDYGWGGPPAARVTVTKVEADAAAAAVAGCKHAPAGPASGSDQPATKRMAAPTADGAAGRGAPAAPAAAPRAAAAQAAARSMLNAAAAAAAAQGLGGAGGLDSVPESMQLQSARSLGSILNQLDNMDDAMLMSTDMGMPSDLQVRTSDLQIASEEILRHVPTPEEATATRNTAWL